MAIVPRCLNTHGIQNQHRFAEFGLPIRPAACLSQQFESYQDNNHKVSISLLTQSLKLHHQDSFTPCHIIPEHVNCIGKLSPILSVTLIASLVKHILKGSYVNDKKKFNEEEKNQLNSYSKHYTPH